MLSKLNPIFLLWASLCIKIIFAIFIPIFGDEAYYWFWGQHVQLSYFDHPGMVGWLTWLGSQIKFLPYSIMVRWPFIIMSTLSFYIFIQILQKQISEKSTIIWLSIFYLLNPLLGIGGIFTTPDVPLVFFWSLSLWLALKIIETQKKLFYTFLGVSLGLGLCSKYHIVLFPISIIVSLGLSKQLKAIQPKKLILTALFGLIFSLPVIIWNYGHDWASFAFQLNHGFNGKKFSPLWSVTYILGQLLIFNPFLLIQSVVTLKNNFLSRSAFVQWGFFLISSVRASVEANWPVTAHIQGLAGNQMLNPKLKIGAIFYSFLIWIVLLGALFTDYGQNKFKTLPNSFAATEIWQKVSDYKPLYGPTYQMSSLLQLISGTQVLKLNELSRVDFYDSDLFPYPTTHTYYVLKYDITKWPGWMEEASLNIKKIDTFPEYSLALYRVSHE